MENNDISPTLRRIIQKRREERSEKLHDSALTIAETRYLLANMLGQTGTFSETERLRADELYMLMGNLSDELAEFALSLKGA